MESLFFQIFIFNLITALIFFIAGYLLSESRIKKITEDIAAKLTQLPRENYQRVDSQADHNTQNTVLKEVLKEVPVEKIVIKEIIKEVPIEKHVITEVIREVPVEKIVYRDRPVEVVPKIEKTQNAAVSTSPPPVPTYSLNRVNKENQESEKSELTLIWGIGERMAQMLKENFNLETLEQLANLDPPTEHKLSIFVGFDKVNKQAWIKQAKKLVNERAGTRNMFVIS